MSERDYSASIRLRLWRTSSYENLAGGSNPSPSATHLPCLSQEGGRILFDSFGPLGLAFGTHAVRGLDGEPPSKVLLHCGPLVLVAYLPTPSAYPKKTIQIKEPPHQTFGKYDHDEPYHK